MHGTTRDSAAAPATLTRVAALPLVLIVSLFFLWGVANNLNDILITQFKKAFVLSDFQAGLVQSAFYLGYFFFAMPAGLFMQRFGYKSAVVAGLVLYAVGAMLFYPAAEAHHYGSFLLALFVLASGLAFLETSANPLVTKLGPPSGAARRLNFAQAFNPLGAISGVLVGQHFIFSGVERSADELAEMAPAARAAYYASESAAVQGPYLVIGTIVAAWAVLVLATRFPRLVEPDNEGSSSWSQVAGLMRNRGFVLSVVAQFFYVGAQVGIWSYLIRYAQDTVPGTTEKGAANFLTLSLVLFVIGRFAGTLAMRFVSASRLLAGFALVNVVLTAIAIVDPGQVGLYALVAVSFFMSVMFPTIFALGLSGLGSDESKLGSSLLVMAIIGGALLTAAMGLVSDLFGIHRSMSVPLLCFAVVFAFALRASRCRTL